MHLNMKGKEEKQQLLWLLNNPERKNWSTSDDINAIFAKMSNNKSAFSAWQQMNGICTFRKIQKIL